MARCFASSIDPLRPPRSKMRYESVADVVSCERAPELVAGRVGSIVPNDVPFVEALTERPPLTPTSNDGNSDPRVEPYDSAAARALSQDSRVVGFLRRARSTTASRSSAVP